MDNIVLITGSGGGLGRELAKVYARNKFKIILHDRDLEKLSETLRELKSIGNVEYSTCTGDLRDLKVLENLAETAISQGVSILINNAANYFHGDLSEDPVEDILQTNLIAPIILTKKIFPNLIKCGRGKIINILSVDALDTKGYQASYCASKFGLRGFTESLRFEAKKNNIQIIGIYLGGMNTPMYVKTGKNDASLCMNPEEVAEIIFNSIKSYTLTGVDSITISRQKY
jgi:short-subunit dehydrogenase